MSQLLQYYKTFQQHRQPAASATPTFEDLTIDDSLSELQRLVKYAKSPIGLQRLVHVKMLAYVSSNQSIDVVISQIVPLLDSFANDNEPAIRQNLVEQLVPFSKYCSCQDKAGYRVILDSILPVVSKLLEDGKPEVRHAAGNALVELSKLINNDDLGQYVLTIVLRLAHEDDKEEMRMTASELLNMLAESLGQDLCRQFVIPEVVSLAEDPVFRVRKSTALNFHNICKVGGEHELFERLMPAFVRLSKDDMYRVRRACAESLSDISKYVSNDIRIGVLVEIFLRLAQDPSRLVKQSILQQSGIFISTLPPRVVNETILNHYCSMANEPTGDMTVDAELKHHCAYSFPAVLQTIGSKRWREIRSVYHSLVQSRSVNVKQTLAASLHEVAKILSDGNDLEEELVPIFEEMIQDVEEVQMGVIKNLAVFLALLPEPCRVSYLPVLHDLLHNTNPFNWRLRRALAIQLSDLIDLPPREEVYTMLFPLVMTLLQDPVAEVRRDSYKGVAKLILVLYEQSKLETQCKSESDQTPVQEKNDDLTVENILINTSTEKISSSSNKCQATHELEAVIRGVNIFIRGDTYQTRQLWLEMCCCLLCDLPRELFEKSFIEGILKLTTDNVSNVRVAVSSLLTGWAPEYCSPWDDDGSVSQKNSSMLTTDGNITAISTHDTTMIIDPPPAVNITPKKSSPWTWLLQRPDIRECVKRLSRDDYDVYYNMIKLQPLFPEIVFDKMSCRGLKSPPGGSEVIEYSGVTSELSISLELQDDEMTNGLLLSPGHGGLDLSDSTAAHINYHHTAMNRSSASDNAPETLDSIEGFEEFMDAMDMGPIHPSNIKG